MSDIVLQSLLRQYQDQPTAELAHKIATMLLRTADLSPTKVFEISPLSFLFHTINDAFATNALQYFEADRVVNFAEEHESVVWENTYTFANNIHIDISLEVDHHRPWGVIHPASLDAIVIRVWMGENHLTISRLEAQKKSKPAWEISVSGDIELKSFAPRRADTVSDFIKMLRNTAKHCPTVYEASLLFFANVLDYQPKTKKRNPDEDIRKLHKLASQGDAEAANKLRAAERRVTGPSILTLRREAAEETLKTEMSKLEKKYRGLVDQMLHEAELVKCVDGWSVVGNSWTTGILVRSLQFDDGRGEGYFGLNIHFKSGSAEIEKVNLYPCF